MAAGALTSWANEAERGAATSPVPPAPAHPVVGAIAYAGADAVTYALARLPPRGPARVAPPSAAAHQLENPAYAVRYAHAASTLRQAADLGLDRGEAAEFGLRLLAHPSEQALLCQLSWLPERVAGAARRRRLDALARFLESLAPVYLDCLETCPAVRPGEWPGGRTPQSGAARLCLAAAAQTALRAGLGLLGVAAPGRL